MLAGVFRLRLNPSALSWLAFVWVVASGFRALENRLGRIHPTCADRN